MAVVIFTLGRFTHRESAADTHLTGGWVGSRAGLDAVTKRQIPYPCREPNPVCPAQS